MEYSTEAFIEGQMEKGREGTLKELVAQEKYERETEGERKDEGELTPEEKQERAEGNIPSGYVIPTNLI